MGARITTETRSLKRKDPLTPMNARWLATLALLGSVFLWGSSFIALKIAFRHYDPMVVIFGRMAIASMCFLFFLNKFKDIIYRKGDFKYLLFMAFCEPCLYFIFEAKAIENTTAAQAGIITATLPLLVAVAAGLLLNEKITRHTLAGGVLALAGACWLSVGGTPSPDAPNPALGNFFEFIAMVCATGYIITLKHLTNRYSALFLTAVQAFVGAIFYLPFLFLPHTTLPTYLAPASAIAIVYLGAFITIGAYGLYNYANSRIPASQAVVFINLIPVVSVALGWIVLGETFTGSQYAASILVFAGVYVSQEREPRKTAESTG